MHAHSHNMVKKSVARAEALELARKRRDGHEQQNDEKQKRTRRALDTYDDNRTAKNMLKRYVQENNRLLKPRVQLLT